MWHNVDCLLPRKLHRRGFGPATPALPAAHSTSRHSPQAAILRDMRDRNIVQFVGICMGSEEEGQPDEAMMIQEFMEAGDLVNIVLCLRFCPVLSCTGGKLSAPALVVARTGHRAAG